VNYFSPVLSPDGHRLFFNSRWTNGVGPKSGTERIWYIEKNDNGDWQSPVLVSNKINNAPLHWQVSVDNSGNLFFGSERKGSFGKDYRTANVYWVSIDIQNEILTN
jgi:hypothetical protein